MVYTENIEKTQPITTKESDVVVKSEESFSIIEHIKPLVEELKRVSRYCYISSVKEPNIVRIQFDTKEFNNNNKNPKDIFPHLLYRLYKLTDSYNLTLSTIENYSCYKLFVFTYFKD